MIELMLVLLTFFDIVIMIVPAKILECEGNISPSSFYMQLPDC